MKKIYTLLILTVILFSARPLISANYLGIGAGYLIPQGTFADVNSPSAGFNIHYENRSYCKLWYGLQFDYFDMKENTDKIVLNYYDNLVMVSPQIRYNLFIENCYDTKFFPYVTAKMHFSSLSNTDKSGRFGIGGGLGAGVNLGFNFLSTCWNLDLGALYSSPDLIYRNEKRDGVSAIIINLNLSVGLNYGKK